LPIAPNISSRETWAETFDSLKRYTLAVRDRVCPADAYAIGLRLSQRAAQELSDPAALLDLQRWLGQNHCYVFTNQRLSFWPFSWRARKRNRFMCRTGLPLSVRLTPTCCFDLLAQLVPAGIEGSVSTLPGSFKEFIHTPEEAARIRANIWHCVETHCACQRGKRVEPSIWALNLSRFAGWNAAERWFTSLTACGRTQA